MEEATRERRSVDLMLVLNAGRDCARRRETTRGAKDDDEDATAASPSVVESLRVKLVDAGARRAVNS